MAVTDLHVPYEKQALTANGGSDGTLTVTSTTNLRKGARINLKSSAVDGIELIIDSIVDATHILVRDPTKIGTLRFNASAYLLADSAAVYQNPQTDAYAREFFWLA